jgi:threonine aldolase
MANQSAVWALTEPGTEIFLDAECHILHYELAGAAALSGVQVRPVAGSNGGLMDPESLERAFRPASPHYPAASLVCLENTHNGAGGKVTPLAGMRSIEAVARGRRIPVHLDGARLWNASAATGTSLAELASCADTVMVSFAKGLGAPVGAALAGSAQHMARARMVRKRLGGGMRQSGILAAGCLHGLANHMDRLVDDHANAKEFATIVDGAGGARVVPPDTNIVMVDLPDGVDSGKVVAAAKAQGLLVTPWNPTRIRAVTHLDVSADDVRRAAGILATVLSS